MLCVAEEAGRLLVVGCSEQERGWVLRIQRKSWLSRMNAVELLRVPLVFGRAHADLTLSEGGAVGGDEDRGWRPPGGRGEHGGDAVGSSLRAAHGDSGISYALRSGPAGLGRGGRG